MNANSRRSFLKQSAALGAAATVAMPAIARSQSSANGRIRVGLLGLGGRMRPHVLALDELAEAENVEIVAICDCDQRMLDSAEKRYPPLEGKKLARFSDMRKMFEGDVIDAVSISTGDRWHALSTIWACQAGKDVYVEKPATMNLFEGQQLAAAAKKYGRMVQHGTQNRSSPNIAEGIEKLREGIIGDVYMARGIDYKIRGNLGRHNPSPVPDGLDWDAWTGPAPLKEFSNFNYRRWYWIRDYANGPFANQAIHEMDILRWGLGLEEHPVKIQAMGGQWVHDDDRTVPTHAAWSFEFAPSAREATRKNNKPTVVSYEHRSWYTNAEAGFGEEYQFVQKDFPVGTIFFGTDGIMTFPNYSSYRTFFGTGREPGPAKVDPANTMADAPHFANWLQACRSRDGSTLAAGPEELTRSMALVHLAKAAYYSGQQYTFDPVKEQPIDAPEVARVMEPYDRAPYTIPREV
jgi:predicted dehydrogenase